MNWLQLKKFLADIADDDVSLSQPIEVFNGDLFTEVQLVGQLGVDDGGLVFIPVRTEASA